MDVAEIGLETLSWKMPQGNEGPLMATSAQKHVALDLAIAALVAVFVLETTKHLHGGVALLGRRLLVVGQDLVDDRVEGSEDRSGPVSGLWTRTRLAMFQDVADRPA